MKNTCKRIGWTALGLFFLLCASQAHAADDTRAELEQLRLQMEQLMQRNQELGERISQMERERAGSDASRPVQVDARHQDIIEREVARQLSEKEEKGGFRLGNHIKFSGLFEGDFFAGKDALDPTGAHTTEFDLATMELYIDMMVTDWATGRIVIEYDDDDDKLRVDEAHVTLGNIEKFPLFLTVGRLYVPFGDFSTHMLQDPFTQVLGEINDEGAILGASFAGVTASVFTYNGMDKDDLDNDTVNGYGASLTYGFEDDSKNVNIGVAWVSNIADSSELSDVVEENVFADNAATGQARGLSDEVSALAAFVNGAWGPVGLIAEYVQALDRFEDREFAYGGDGAKPAAMNLELAYTTSVYDLETVFALGYQRSWESVDFLPKHRYIGTTSFGIFEGTTLTFEYYYDENYTVGSGGTDSNGHGFTTRLAYEF